MKIKKDDTEFIIVSIITYMIFNFIAAALLVNSDNKCTYNSIFARINVGYVISCELVQPRYEETKNDAFN